jgi:hypothetical protein
MVTVWRNPRAQMFLQMLATIVIGFGIWRLSYYLGCEVSLQVLRAIDPPGNLLPLTFGIAILTSIPFIVGLPLKGVICERITMSHILLLALMPLALMTYHILQQPRSGSPLTLSLTLFSAYQKFQTRRSEYKSLYDCLSYLCRVG